MAVFHGRWKALCLLVFAGLAGTVQAGFNEPPAWSPTQPLFELNQASYSHPSNPLLLSKSEKLESNDSTGLLPCGFLGASSCTTTTCSQDFDYFPPGCDEIGDCRTTSRRRSSLFGFGLVQPSDRCFDDFISPMSNPVFFEDPRTLTEIRFIALHHRLPAALGGNSIQAYAPQIRLALSDRLSLIVTKGSVLYTQSPLLESGFLDIAAGFKYNLWRDASAGRILSCGMTFEAPSGSRKSLQGNGDGEFNLFLTGGTRIGQRSHWLSATNLRQPVDEAAENRIWQWSNHFDYRIGNRPLYAFTEVNWFHYLTDGAAFPLPIEGGDIFNLGSVGVKGNNLVTQAVGLKAKPRRNMETGFAYEFPLSDLRGLMDHRLTADLIVRF